MIVMACEADGPESFHHYLRILGGNHRYRGDANRPSGANIAGGSQIVSTCS
jgi:hypothetical protein